MPLVPVDNALLEHLHMSRLQWVHGGTGVGSLPLLFCIKEAPEFIYINFDKFWDLNLVLIDSGAVEGGGGGGTPGLSIPGLEGEEGEPGLTIPGLPGAKGEPGVTIPGLEGDEGEPGLTIPGSRGEKGESGLTIPGLEGDEGEPGLTIPGPAGADGGPGLTIIGPPGIDGEDGGIVPVPNHPEVTFHADLSLNLLAILGQQLDLNTQNPNLFFAGPAAGAVAKPTFRALVAADIPTDFATEEWVINLIGAIANFFLYPDLSDLGAPYYIIQSDHSLSTATNFTTGAIGGDGNTLIYTGVSSVAETPANFVTGLIDFHVHALRVSGGRNLRVYCTFHVRSAGGVDGAAFATTELTNLLTANEQELDAHAVLAADQPFAANERLVIKVYINANGGVPNASVGRIIVAGATASHISVGIDASAFDHIYMTPAAHTAIGDGAPHHAAVTLQADLGANLMALAAQQLDLDAQAASLAFAGPTAGNPPAKPSFRSLLQTDLASDWRNFVETLAREQLYHEYEFDIAGTWVSHLHGSGSVRYNTQHILDISSSNVANGACLVRHERFAGWQMGVIRSMIDWDRRFLINLLLTPCEGSANGDRRFTLGKDHSNVFGVPTDKAIGVSFGPPGVGPGYVTAVTGFAHDGVNFWTLALGNVQGFSTHQFLLINNGDAHVDFWIDGVAIGTIHTGPTGLATANFCIFQMEVTNAADAAYSILNLHAGRTVWDNS